VTQNGNAAAEALHQRGCTLVNPLWVTLEAEGRDATADVSAYGVWIDDGIGGNDGPYAHAV